MTKLGQTPRTAQSEQISLQPAAETGRAANRPVADRSISSLTFSGRGPTTLDALEAPSLRAPGTLEDLKRTNPTLRLISDRLSPFVATIPDDHNMAIDPAAAKQIQDLIATKTRELARQPAVLGGDLKEATQLAAAFCKSMKQQVAEGLATSLIQHTYQTNTGTLEARKLSERIAEMTGSSGGRTSVRNTGERERSFWDHYYQNIHDQKWSQVAQQQQSINQKYFQQAQGGILRAFSTYEKASAETSKDQESLTAATAAFFDSVSDTLRQCRSRLHKATTANQGQLLAQFGLRKNITALSKLS